MSEQTRIQLYQMSSRFRMSDIGYWEDFEFAASKAPNLIAVTESGTRNLAKARDYGYRPVSTRGTNNDNEVTIFLAHQHTLIDQGQVAGGSWVSKGQRVFSPILWVGFRVAGHKVYAHESHWVARTTDAGHVDPSERDKYLAHLHTTNVMVEQVKKHGRGKNISFFMGDLNVSEQADNAENNPNLPNHIFRTNGLLTIYDELGVRPKEGGTFGSAIYDIIGSYKKDNSVTGIRYNIWPKQHSDHRPVSAWYDITEARKSSVGQTPDPEPTPSEDPSYVTGGNIDYSDYQGNDIYPMPVATEDSANLDPHG
jgi:hypothetical protein